MKTSVKWLFAGVIIWFFLLPFSSATVTMQQVGIVKNYTKNQAVSGNLSISYNEYIGDAFLFVQKDGSDSANVSLYPYIGDISSYSFALVPFKYNASIHGRSTWKRYPSENFYFSIRVDSKCGGVLCSTQTSDIPGSIAKNEGLKFIINGWDQIGTIPNEDADAERVWAIIPNPNNPSSVQLTMRKECGKGNYSGIMDMDSDGWYIRELRNPILVGTKAIFYIDPFDHQSISAQRNLFGGNGGVFKDGQLVTTGIEWNGATGNINITTGFDSRSAYSIVFLPPNGPKVCAYTNTSIPEQSAEWYVTIILNGETRYLQPYNETIPGDIFNNILPPCPQGTYECNVDRSSWIWNAYKVEDPQNTIGFSFDAGTRRVVATTINKQLTAVYTKNINITSLGIKSDIAGLHTLTFILKRDAIEIARLSVPFNICEDADGDGFCIEHGDCNDNNPTIYFSAPELCNDRDDNCNGITDEDFTRLGWRKGDACGLGVCTGTLVCSSDSRNLTCNSLIKPGDLEEICNNKLDDNCNGEIDEEDITIDGIPTKCVCNSGTTKPCGINKGSCRQGYSLCIAGKWSMCIDSIGPREEVCNEADDDCNGIVDDVGGGNSAESTRCGCYGDATPKSETCNGIDDDCDGYVDNGIACCSRGETRSCGISIGICKAGVSKCIEGGWGPCTGIISPLPEEICYNNLDDNCNGEIDEGCTGQSTCFNQMKDLNEEGIDCGGSCVKKCIQPGLFIIIAIFAIIIIILFIILQVRGLSTKTRGAERTLSEEMGE